MDKKFWATTFTLTGGTIGAGILGLPYVFAKSSFISGLFWIITLGAIMIFINLTLGEITLRTKSTHQLAGYAKKYLGKTGEKAMVIVVIFGIYSALLAYLVGEGQSFAKIIPGNIPPMTFGILFWLALTLLLREGLRGLKKIETWGVLAIIGIIFGILIKFIPQMHLSNLTTLTSTNFTLPIGVVLFSLLGFIIIPELRREINGEEKNMGKAILIGTSIPIILYIIFSAIFIGVLGKNITEVATLSFGSIVTILGIFTIFTCYLALSFALKDMLKYDLKISGGLNFFFVSIVPLTTYILITIFDLIDFVSILGIGGTISGGLTAILILLMARKAKSTTRNKRGPEINMPTNWFITIILSTIFIAAIILELVY